MMTLLCLEQASFALFSRQKGKNTKILSVCSSAAWAPVPTLLSATSQTNTRQVSFAPLHLIFIIYKIRDWTTVLYGPSASNNNQWFHISRTSPCSTHPSYLRKNWWPTYPQSATVLHTWDWEQVPSNSVPFLMICGDIIITVKFLLGATSVVILNLWMQ